MRLLIISQLVVVLIIVLKGYSCYFTEHLFIEPFSHGRVATHLIFTHQLKVMPHVQNDHFYIFPRSISEIVEKYHIKQFQLSFTQGCWDFHMYGDPAFETHPTGAELYAWLSNEYEDIDSIWEKFTNSLAGLFCASLNLMTRVNTVIPEYTYSKENSENASLRYSLLAGEIVCTENLTPFIKLLPCLNRSGLASLLNAYKLYRSDYHSMTIGFNSTLIANDPSTIQWNLIQTITTVFDVSKSNQQIAFSLLDLYNKTVIDTCPVSTSTNIYISTSKLHKNSDFKIHSNSFQKINTNLYAFKNVTKAESLSTIYCNYTKEMGALDTSSRSNVLVDRYFTGFGLERSQYVMKMKNIHESQSYNLTCADIFPWQMQMFMHTFKIEEKNLLTGVIKNKAIPSFIYSPAIPRVQPTFIEANLNIPPHSEIIISIDFFKLFMRYNEYLLYNVNRGLDVGSAKVTVHSQRSDLYAILSNKKTQLYIHTPTLLLTIPSPDFTMPFNVITFTMLISALFYETIFNLLYRQYYIVENKYN